MALKGIVFLSRNVATEYQCYALCSYTRPCDSFSWRETTRLCELREKTTDSTLPVHKEYKGITEPLCMNAKHTCAHRPCRNYEVCIPVLAAVHHICLPTADLPGATDPTSATHTDVDGMTTVMISPSSTLNSVNQIMSTSITTSSLATSSELVSETPESSPLTSETPESPSPLTSETSESSSLTSGTTESPWLASETTELSSPQTSEAPEPSPLASETIELPSLLTSGTNSASVEGTTGHTTAAPSALTSIRSSTVTSIRSSAVTSAITDTSSALTGESTQPPNTATFQQLHVYTYLGCFNDSMTRALNGSFLESSTMNHNICFQHCMPYRYAGLEFSDECFCDNDLAPDHQLQNDSNCNNVCSGNSDETCGGFWFIEIYELVLT